MGFKDDILVKQRTSYTADNKADPQLWWKEEPETSPANKHTLRPESQTPKFEDGRKFN
jgi:hypothetical protein